MIRRNFIAASVAAIAGWLGWTRMARPAQMQWHLESAESVRKRDALPPCAKIVLGRKGGYVVFETLPCEECIRLGKPCPLQKNITTGLAWPSCGGDEGSYRLIDYADESHASLDRALACAVEYKAELDAIGVPTRTTIIRCHHTFDRIVS